MIRNVWCLPIIDRDSDVMIGKIMGWKVEPYGSDQAGQYSYVDTTGRACYPLPYFHRAPEECLLKLPGWAHDRGTSFTMQFMRFTDGSPCWELFAWCRFCEREPDSGLHLEFCSSVEQALCLLVLNVDNVCHSEDCPRCDK